MKVPSYARHTPPDATGWWYIHMLLITQPFLVHLNEERLEGVRASWQDTSSCWRLEDTTDTPVEKILSTALGQPQLVWDLAVAIRALRVAGPWFELHRGGDSQYFVRLSPADERVAVVRGNRHGWTWQGATVGTGQTATLEEAQQRVDEALRAVGYLLGRE